jgi:cytochrome c biogenesis protein CcmG/thiol:disulfide interchange protein DsbE
MPDIIKTEMPVSKTVSVIGVGSALACALLWTGCSDFGPVKPAAKVETKVETKAAETQAPAQFDLNRAVGWPMPEFKLKDADGQTVHPADYKGKVVLLDFWATWCGPCKVEIPWFMDFERQFKDQGFAVVGVSMDEDGWTVIKPYVQNMKMNYRILLGNDDVGAAYGGLDSLPTTLLIDRQGKIASVHVGVAMGKEEFKNAIVQLLNAPRASAAASGSALALLTRPGSR